MCCPVLTCFIFSCPVTGTEFTYVRIGLYSCTCPEYILPIIQLKTDEGCDKLVMLMFYINQLILFKYWNLGG